MRAVVFCVLVIGIAAVVVFHILRIKKGGLHGLLSKTVASMLFVVVAALSALTANENSVNPERFYVFIIIGLMCGLVGDMLLDLKGVYPQHRNIYITGGIISFATGHTFYLLAIMLNYKLTVINTLVPVFSAIAMAAAIILTAPLFKLDYKKFKPLCFAYAFLLSWTMCQSAAAAIATSFAPLFTVVFIASVLFVVSDLILSHIYFSTLNESENGVKLSNSPLMIAFNHSTYYAAQYLIALSVLLAVPAIA